MRHTGGSGHTFMVGRVLMRFAEELQALLRRSAPVEAALLT